MYSGPRQRVVLLAAGQGKRMRGLGDDTPKSLLPVAGEPFAVRLVRQAFEHGIEDVTAVVGYRSELVRDTIASAAPGPVRFIVNDRYQEDVNIHSLSLALTADRSPCLVVEADIWVHDSVWDDMLATDDVERSVWYTRGRFGKDQVGGILHAGPQRRITDLRVVPAWEPRYADYDKLVGITKVGPGEVDRFFALLIAARDRNMNQYWLAPWIENLAELPCYARDVGRDRAISVNTPDEYRALQDQVGR